MKPVPLPPGGIVSGCVPRGHCKIPDPLIETMKKARHPGDARELHRDRHERRRARMDGGARRRAPGRAALGGAVTVQAYLGHKDIRHAVRYTELSPVRFKGLRKD
jgi:hypothetical protein